MRSSAALASALVVALVASGSSAAGALAKPSLLFLRDTEEGPIAGSGLKVGPLLELNVGGELCSDSTVGKVTVNGKAKDVIKPEHDELACEAVGSTASGAVKTVEVTSKGQVTVKASPRLAIATTRCNDAFCTSEYPCVFEISKLGGSLALPHYIELGLSGVAKRNSKSSSPLCPRTEEVSGFLEVYSPRGALYAET